MWWLERGLGDGELRRSTLDDEVSEVARTFGTGLESQQFAGRLELRGRGYIAVVDPE